MPSAWKVALGSLLGGVSGGTQGFVDQKNKQREFALKQLENIPSSVRELGLYKKMPTEDQADLLNLKAAGSGMGFTIPKGDGGPVKGPVTPKEPSEYDKKMNRWLTLEGIKKSGKPLTQAQEIEHAALRKTMAGKPIDEYIRSALED